MKAYYVNYKMHECDSVKGMQVLANNKADAYDKATYEAIPKVKGTIPYSCWVANVTYNNGNVKRFNTHEGKPY